MSKRKNRFWRAVLRIPFWKMMSLYLLPGYVDGKRGMDEEGTGEGAGSLPGEDGACPREGWKPSAWQKCLEKASRVWNGILEGIWKMAAGKVYGEVIMQTRLAENRQRRKVAAMSSVSSKRLRFEEILYRISDEDLYKHGQKKQKRNRQEKLSLGMRIAYLCYYVALGFTFIRFVLLAITMDPAYTDGIFANPVYLCFSVSGPFVLWVLSIEWLKGKEVYKTPKVILFAVAVLHGILVLIMPLFRIGLVSAMSEIEASLNLDSRYLFPSQIKTMRYISVIPPLVIGGGLVYHSTSAMMNPLVRESLIAFKFTDMVDIRKNKKHLYDLDIAWDADSGRKRPIYEEDRYLSLSVVGNSGTGKTSMIFLPGIAQDLNTKILNDDERQRKLCEMVYNDQAILDIPDDAMEKKGPFVFRDSYVVPKKEFEDDYERILRDYKTCCIIVVAPDNDLTDNVARLAIARGIRPVYIDPTLMVDPVRYQEFKNYIRGFNPFYVPEYLRDYVKEKNTEDKKKLIWDEAKVITEIAKNVASNLETIDQRRSGAEGSRFFSGVNRNITVKLTCINILYYTHCENRQATWLDIQKSMYFGDGKDLEEKMEGLMEKFGTCKDRGKDNTRTADASVRTITGHGTNGRDTGCPLSETPWEPTFNYIFDEMINEERRAKVMEFSYGLRNIVDEFLQNPFVKDVYTSSNENIVDMSDAFETGGVILCNYGLRFGSDTAVSCGLAFQLMVNQALVNRTLPKNRSQNPTPVFEYIDELPQLLANGEWLQMLLSLGRKYGMCLSTTLQTLSQFEALPRTNYLQQLVVGVGNLIVFHRTSKQDQEVLSAISGLVTVEEETLSESRKSFAEDDTSNSYSRRTTVSRELKAEGGDLRIGKKGEAVLYSTTKGNVNVAKFIRCDYIKEVETQEVRRLNIDWLRVAKYKPKSEADNRYLEELRQDASRLSHEEILGLREAVLADTAYGEGEARKAGERSVTVFDKDTEEAEITVSPRGTAPEVIEEPAGDRSPDEEKRREVPEKLPAKGQEEPLQGQGMKKGIRDDPMDGGDVPESLDFD